MVTRARLDAELVRRGLARSRQQAAELIEQGRVAVRGITGGEAGHRRRSRHAGHRASRRPSGEWASRGAHKLIGALDALGDRSPRACAASTPAPPPAASPTCCWTAAPPRSSPSTSDTGSSSGGCAAMTRVQVHDRTNVRALSPPRSAGRSSSPSPTCRSSRCARCCPRSPPAPTGRRAAADGQAAVRGRQASGWVPVAWCAIRGCGSPRWPRSSAAARELGLRLRRSGREPAARPVGQRRVLPAACGATAATSATTTLSHAVEMGPT